MQVALDRGGDAGLVRAVEVDLPPLRTAVCCVPVDGERSGDAGSAQHAGTRDQVPPAEPTRLGHGQTAAAVSSDSGSPRPSTTRASSRRCASVTVS